MKATELKNFKSLWPIVLDLTIHDPLDIEEPYKSKRIELKRKTFPKKYCTDKWGRTWC